MSAPIRPSGWSASIPTGLHVCPVCGVGVRVTRRGPLLVTVTHANPLGARCVGAAVGMRAVR